MDTQLCTVRAFSLTLSLPLAFFLSFSLSFSLENTHLKQLWTTSLDPIQGLYIHKNLFFFFYFFKNVLLHTMRAFLLLSLSLSLFSCAPARPPPIFSLYTLPRHQLDSKSRHALPRVSKRETEKLIKVELRSDTRHDRRSLCFSDKRSYIRHLK